jgi:DNA-binding transcriptional LysR family regulator
MNAPMQRHPRPAPAGRPQRRLDGPDLSVVLALVRAGNLAGAGQLMGVDGSTVFRAVQRAEKALGQRLFERSRAGYRATELGAQLAQHAERIEAELEAARSMAQSRAGCASGTVRISTTDTLLHGLLLPALAPLMALHPHLLLDVSASNELADLSRRDADIALRATRRPPPHLVGRELGPIRVAIYAARQRGRSKAAAVDLGTAPWLAVDDALPEHPSVRWRRKHLPQVQPRLRVNSIQSVFEGIVAGAGIGIVPLFLAQPRAGLVALSEPLKDCETTLWLLTHPESRHLRRIATVAQHLAEVISLR